MWAGARATNPYDIGEVTSLQTWLGGARGPRAFVYPPSSLPIFFPFGLLPFWPAFWAWTALSAALFWLGARQITKHAALSFLAPQVVLSIGLGQTALFTGAATLWGVSLLKSRPFLAGLCFGVGAALKPQCFLLAPIAFASGRHWKAFGGAVLAWSVFAIPAVAMWPDWWRVAQQLPGIIARYYPYIVSYEATPSYFAHAIGAPALLFQVAGIVLGVAVVWAAFRSEDNVTRVIGLISGTLLASPYALRYELAALAPALVDSFMLGTLRGGLAALPLLCMNVLTIVPAITISALSALWPIDRIRTPDGHVVQRRVHSAKG